MEVIRLPLQEDVNTLREVNGEKWWTRKISIEGSKGSQGTSLKQNVLHLGC